RRGYRAECYWGRVRQLANGGGKKRRKSHTGKHRRRNSDWCSESGTSFDECREGECDEHHLATAVGGGMTNGAFDNVGLAAVLPHSIQKNCGENHPSDWKKSKGCPISDRCEQHPQRHAVHGAREYSDSSKPCKGSHPGRLSSNADQKEKNKNRYSGDD